ncbi:MAG: 2'-5' RNA ligase family protein [Leifsonia sp.]|uniref:2'-5' RNA ligase family protein n=1 Tax=Leifsonia sp. TaxID=1870902 RepID=UPI003F7F6528
MTAFIRARYGLISAGAFPPHVTLAGSLPITNEERLHEVIEQVLPTQVAFPVHNRGVQILGDIVIYDVDSIDGQQNQRLRALAISINDAVRPLLHATSGLPADTHDGSRFHAHLSLASHELYERTDLRQEIAAFAAALPVAVPKTFTADTITLYRFEHPTWEGPWWTTMTWSHRRTWHLRQRS